MTPHSLRRNAILLAAPLIVGMALTACSTSGTQTSSAGASVDQGKVTVDGAKCAADATKALDPGADIVIGSSLAMSGAGASAAVSLGGANALFDSVNAAGGIDGHKFKLDAKDDALDPARAVANVKTLIEQDHVFATLMQLGTPQSQATRPMYEKSCTPQLSVSSGAPDFYDPAAHAWSTSNFLPYKSWGEATSQYLQKQFPQGAKVGEVLWTSDVGKASDTGFQGAIKGTNVQVVSQQSHDSSAVSLSNQVGAILAKSPDAIVASTGGSFCNQVASAARQAGFTGPIIFPLACRDTAQFFEPLGDMATNVLTVRSAEDPAGSKVADNPAVKTYFNDMRTYQPSTNARSTYVADGYRNASVLVDQLKRAAKATGGLTRVNLMDAVWTTDTTLPMDFPGARTVINGSHPFPVGHGEMLDYNAASKSWTSTGVTVDAGKS